jgi:hypothetical protein
VWGVGQPTVVAVPGATIGALIQRHQSSIVERLAATLSFGRLDEAPIALAAWRQVFECRREPIALRGQAKTGRWSRLGRGLRFEGPLCCHEA